MLLVPFSSEHVPLAAALAAKNHEAERKHVSLLPERSASHYEPLLAAILEKNIGVAAFEGECFAGYLIGEKVTNFKGTQNGIYVPEWGNGAAGSNRRWMYSRMYQHIAARWVDNGCFTHALTLFAHDAEAINTWFRLAFGMICGDGLRPLTPVDDTQNISREISVRIASAADIPLVYPLTVEHSRYYPAAPLFMPLLSCDGEDKYRSWLRKHHHNLWLAFIGDEVVGYFQSSPSHTGACEMIASPTTCSVSSAYVRPEYRRKGVAVALLNAVIVWAAENGYERCAVDYEVHNLYGSRFWERHFTPVSASLLRRIDERVAWAHAERDLSNLW
jgi:GNAT superfamily N-acetyltransferase